MKKIILMLTMLVIMGLTFAACAGCTPREPTEPTPSETPRSDDEETGEEMAVDFSAAIASVSGTWVIAYGNSGITLSEDSRFQINWDNATIINGLYTIARHSETDYKLTLVPDRVRNMSANQPEYGSPRFDDEEPGSSPNWMQQEIIINPSNRNHLGLVGHDGVVEWVDIWFDSEVLWLEDRI